MADLSLPTYQEGAVTRTLFSLLFLPLAVSLFSLLMEEYHYLIYTRWCYLAHTRKIWSGSSLALIECTRVWISRRYVRQAQKLTTSLSLKKQQVLFCKPERRFQQTLPGSITPARQLRFVTLV